MIPSLTDVRIRPMTMADYDAVYALWLRCPGMGLNDVDDSRAGIARYLARNPQTALVAEEAGRMVGVIMAGHDGRRGYIHHTAVLPECQQRGVGRALVEQTLAALKEQGISKVALVAFERNAAGNAFWEKLGFTRREDLVYRNRQLVEMERMET